MERARLLAAAESESGLWLQANPAPSLGTQLDADTLKVAVALRIGAPVCDHGCAGAEPMLIHLVSITWRADLELVDLLDIPS